MKNINLCIILGQMYVLLLCKNPRRVWRLLGKFLGTYYKLIYIAPFGRPARSSFVDHLKCVLSQSHHHNSCCLKHWWTSHKAEKLICFASRSLVSGLLKIPCLPGCSMSSAHVQQNCIETNNFGGWIRFCIPKWFHVLCLICNYVSAFVYFCKCLLIHLSVVAIELSTAKWKSYFVKGRL